MRICVLGLWHLGSVTAACLPEWGHEVVGLDFDEAEIARLNAGAAPIQEPGLEPLLTRGFASGRLRFTSNIAEAVPDAEVLWITYDTGTGAENDTDDALIISQIERVLSAVDADTTVIVSSQLPIGFVRRLQQRDPSRSNFACCPENLRLGHAVSDFLQPQRIIVGVPPHVNRQLLQRLFGPLAEAIEWVSVESAEVTKHALNGFLAASVAFANEVAAICERAGADAKEVERCLKGDSRIGVRAYLAPGAAFAGGTLARGVTLLKQAAREYQLDTPLLSAILTSNAAHKEWARHKLESLFAELRHATVTVWGLSYKPGTDTLRGSLAVELCDWLLDAGASVRVHDPVVKNLPTRWRETVQRYEDPLAAVVGADALVVGTSWPQYCDFSAEQLLARDARLVVLDSNGVLHSPRSMDAQRRYFAVGRAECVL